MLLIFIFSIFLLAMKFQPNVEYINKSKMWICHYNYKHTRKYFILWRI